MQIKVHFYRSSNSAAVQQPCLNAERIVSLAITLHRHLCIVVSFSVQCAVISMPVFFTTCGTAALDQHFNTWEMSQKQINLLRFNVSQKFKCVQFKHNRCRH